MSIINLTGTTWLFDATPNSGSIDEHEVWSINFVSNGGAYTSLEVYNDYQPYCDIYYNSTLVWNEWTASPSTPSWANSAYRTIQIVDGADVGNPDLIAWLEATATQQATNTQFDLSSLTWSVGAHTIRVKAKGTGYRDSAFSTSVSYPIYQQLTTPIAVVSGSRLSATAVNHGNATEIYANDVLQTSWPYVLGTNFDLDTLNLPAGTYTIKVRAIDNTAGTYYLPSEMTTAGTYTVLPQLDAPTNVSVTGTEATFDEVQNAEQYEVYVDGTSIGLYTPTSGYTVAISAGGASGFDVNVYDGQDTGAPFLAAVPGDGTITQVVCTSGYLCIDSVGVNLYDEGTCSGGVSILESGKPMVYSVVADGAIEGVDIGCFVEGTKILLADNTIKNVEDIAYDDELLVWDFYESKLSSAKPRWIMRKRTTSEYKKVLLSDGTELKLVGQGDNCHRLFNVTKQKMLYANECVGDEVATIHGIVTVLSCEKVQETVNYYNIITDTHYNLFAEGVLASCRLSNKYKIEDMKYVGEPLISEEEEQEYFNKLASVAKER